jgi:hypothetical protein
MWKNIVQQDGPQMTLGRKRTACWTTKATYAHSEYVTLIAFHGKNGYANAPPCYVIRALPAFPNPPTQPLCPPLRPRKAPCLLAWDLLLISIHYIEYLLGRLCNSTRHPLKKKNLETKWLHTTHCFTKPVTKPYSPNKYAGGDSPKSAPV